MTASQPGSRRPGTGGLANRPLHFIWICDCSGSMSSNGKIQALNAAIREAIPHMREVAEENPNAQVLVRALKFSDGAQWHISQAVPIDQFEWTDLDAAGLTDMGLAMKMVAEQLKSPPMPERALPPVLVLITDGVPTDDFKTGLNVLMAEPWGKKAVRVAIAIGNDAEPEPLQKFIGNPEIKPLQASSPEKLIRYIKWASTATIQSASSPVSQVASGAETPATNVPLTPPPVVDVPNANALVDAADIW